MRDRDGSKLENRIFYTIFSSRLKPLLLLLFCISALISTNPIQAQTPQVDLTFSEAPYIKNVGPIVKNSWVKFRVTVVNNGPSEAYNIHVDLYKNEGQIGAGERGEITHTIRRIQPGQEIPIDFIYRVKSGSYRVLFQIDPENALPETNESNNISSAIPFTVEGALTEDPFESVGGGNENDDIDHARSISRDFSENLTLKDNDFYKVSVNQGEFIKARLRSAAYVSAIDLYLYNPGKTIIATSKNHADYEELGMRAPSSGTYYIEVRKNGSNDNPYFLELSVRRMSDLRTEIVAIRSERMDPDADETKEASIDNQNLEGTQVTDNTPKYLVEVDVKAEDISASNDITWSDPCQPIVGCLTTDLVYAPEYHIDLFINRKTQPKAGEVGDFPAYWISAEKYRTSTFVNPKDNDEDDYTRHTQKNYVIHTFQLVLGPGDYTFASVVDTENIIPESSETNNVSDLGYKRILGDRTSDQFEDIDDTFPGALLSQGDYPEQSSWDGREYFHVEVPSGKRLTFTIDYIKAGEDMDLYRLNSDGTKELAVSDSGLNRESISVYNGSSQTKTYYFMVGQPPVCNYILNILQCAYFKSASYDMKVAITNEFDYDVAINSINYSPQPPSYGETLYIQTQVENRGTFPLENITLDIFLLGKNDPAPSSSDTSTTQIAIDSLAPGEKRVVDISTPISGGEYRIYGMLDKGNSIAETDDLQNNNFGPVALYINPALEAGSDDELESAGPEYTDEKGDTFTTNDMWQTATLLTSGSYDQLVAADQDWYKFRLGARKWFSAEVNFTDDVGDIDLMVGRTVKVQVYNDKGEALDINHEKDIKSDGVPPLLVDKFITIRYAGNLGDTEVIQYYNDSSVPLDIYLVAMPVGGTVNPYSLEVVTLDGNENGLADLTIDSFLTTPSPTSQTKIYGGDLIQTMVSVKNSGSWMTTQSATVELYYSGAPRAGEFGDLFQVIPAGMAPGETRYFTFEYSLSGGSYPLHLAVDPGNRVNESDENNNTVQAPYNIVVEGGQSGNIKATSLSANIDSTGKRVSASFQIANSTYNTDFYLKFQLVAGPDDRVVYQWAPVWYQNLFNSGSSSRTLSFDNYLPPGDAKLRMVVDWGNRVGEDNESDNTITAAAGYHTSPNATFSIHTFGEPASGADTVIELYRYQGTGDLGGATVDPSKLNLLRRVDDRIGPFGADTVGLPSGLYFVRVYSYGSSMGEYYIAYGSGYQSWNVGDNTTANITLDETEGDNAPPNASWLLENEPQRKTVSGWHDEDWYQFKVESLWVEFAPSVNLSGVSAKLYRYTGSTPSDLGSATSNNIALVGDLVKGGNKYYFQGALDPGLYFVKVAGPDTVGDYSIIRNRDSSVVLTGPKAHGPNGVYTADSHEPNDSAPSGKKLNSNTEVISNFIVDGDGGDIDWYYFQTGQ